MLPRPQMFDVFPDASDVSICSQRSCLRGGREGWGEPGGDTRGEPHSGCNGSDPGSRPQARRETGLAAAFAQPWDAVGRFSARLPSSLPAPSRCCLAARSRSGLQAALSSPRVFPSLPQSSSPSSQSDAQLFAQGLGSSLPVPPMLGCGVRESPMGSPCILCPKALQKGSPQEQPQSRTGCRGGILRGLTEPLSPRQGGFDDCHQAGLLLGGSNCSGI